ncbi:type IV secretion system protein, partial [Bartonella sp. CB178]|uniref:type IV secretion system protein n=1 Tax=Bartonella sp. CB178 TaxID=3112255 RepID=UPI00300DE63C
MSFVMFTQLFDKFDQITSTYITGVSSKVAIALTPIVSVGITIAFIVYGWLIIRGAVDMPLTDFINRCFRVSIITSIALSGGLYQQDIIDFITNLPSE